MLCAGTHLSELDKDCQRACHCIKCCFLIFFFVYICVYSMSDGWQHSEKTGSVCREHSFCWISQLVTSPALETDLFRLLGFLGYLVWVSVKLRMELFWMLHRYVYWSLTILSLSEGLHMCTTKKKKLVEICGNQIPYPSYRNSYCVCTVHGQSFLTWISGWKIKESLSLMLIQLEVKSDLSKCNFMTFNGF